MTLMAKQSAVRTWRGIWVVDGFLWAMSMLKLKVLSGVVISRRKWAMGVQGPKRRSVHT